MNDAELLEVVGAGIQVKQDNKTYARLSAELEKQKAQFKARAEDINQRSWKESRGVSKESDAIKAERITLFAEEMIVKLDYFEKRTALLLTRYPSLQHYLNHSMDTMRAYQFDEYWLECGTIDEPAHVTQLLAKQRELLKPELLKHAPHEAEAKQ